MTRVPEWTKREIAERRTWCALPLREAIEILAPYATGLIEIRAAEAIHAAGWATTCQAVNRRLVDLSRQARRPA